MDTTTKITMQLLEDLADGDGVLNGEYAHYYESLEEGQPKEVVSVALKRILSESKGATCEFGETGFTLKFN